ncbi:hypothetical protein Tco_1515421 [Tanacetum coccineum]
MMAKSSLKPCLDFDSFLLTVDALIRPLKALETANVALACVRDELWLSRTQGGEGFAGFRAFPPFSGLLNYNSKLGLKEIMGVSEKGLTM